MHSKFLSQLELGFLQQHFQSYLSPYFLLNPPCWLEYQLWRQFELELEVPPLLQCFYQQLIKRSQRCFRQNLVKVQAVFLGNQPLFLILYYFCVFVLEDLNFLTSILRSVSLPIVGHWLFCYQKLQQLKLWLLIAYHSQCDYLIKRHLMLKI